MKTFREILVDNREETVQKYLQQNPIILNSAFGLKWAANECFPKFKFGNEFISDFVIISGQSYSYDITLIEIEPPTEKIFTKNGKYAKRLNEAIGQCNDWLSWINENVEYFKTSVSKKFKDGYKAYEMQPQFMHRIFVSCKIIIGRRNMLTDDDNKRRATIFAQSNKTLEIVPYDRLVEIEKNLSQK